MRRLLATLLIALSAGCGSDLLAPVMTCDGQWNGIQNGYNLNLNMTQTDAGVTGAVEMAGAFGSAGGTVSGTCSAASVNLTLSIDGYTPVSYVGTLSPTVAKISGVLNGSGFTNLEVDVAKR